MVSLEVLNPSGSIEIERAHAPRLDTLSGKTIYLLSNDIWQAHRTLPKLRDLLSERFPESTFVVHTAKVDSEETVDFIQKKGAHGVIVGNAA